MMKSEIVWDESHQLLGTGWSKLPDESRVWLHLANRVLSDEELMGWAEAMEGFLSNWTAHGQGLRASWSLFGRRLLVVGLDESLAGATGCSIDQLMRLIQSEGMGLTPPVDWLTRTHTLYKGDGIWRELDLHAFWAACKAGIIQSDVLLINTVLYQKGECHSQMVLPLSDSWHARMW